MPEVKSTQKVVGVNGNMMTVEFTDRVMQNEVAFAKVGDTRLKCEVIRVRGNRADLQVFESTNGLKVGDEVEFTDELLSVELGPGLLKQVYDGLQNPLNLLAEQSGFFLKRGLYLRALDRDVKWAFTPIAKPGDKVRPGDRIGHVPEGIIKHYIMVPLAWKGEWTLQTVAAPGEYTIDEVMAVAVNDQGESRKITMTQFWPVKIPITDYSEKLLPERTMITQQRTIDTFFPVAVGGTFCTPGPFGAGKTVLQHAISRYAEADVVIIAACGERAGEVVEILREFPELEDPKTGQPLINRSIIICNTSSMPVAAREASVYTAVTLAEYYRQMGLNTLLLADSTSRWAQALREMSGRLEEIPGEEAFPAYLESLIASFYERAGLVRLRTGEEGSVTIGGAVSPAGGNFEEPVTQATLKVVGAFLGLSRERSDARRYPAIHPLDSWSKYRSVVDRKELDYARGILRQGSEVNQMMKVIGEEGTSLDDFVVYLKSEFLDYVYLQQNTFDAVDGATGAERQRYMFDRISKVLEGSFTLPDKDTARRYFLELRQMFMDLNYLPMDSEEFKRQEAGIEAKIAERSSANA
ncbi:V-type ATP synthase subunit A [Victivallis vadensis]|uniref:V-type ATP synthase alpha chain n=1 Tax=Victivallis vadensis TaxID=172901 RepID=A0A848B606_9BACT|nr:V-type ATP synthase subunit A [Victivallis vadensis]NMD89099.1 V-type ATP synthase subunit A [Victivallis vadensis]PWM84830.1 MAG: V-type ATP synthase subunit A [Lentisphaerota bacterium]